MSSPLYGTREPDRAIHEEARITTVDGYDFVALMNTSTVEEKRRWTKAEIIDIAPRFTGLA